jgi:hypothetical protein
MPAVKALGSIQFATVAYRADQLEALVRRFRVSA